MQNLIPIQITLQAVNAFEVRKLVQDLADTMDGQKGVTAPTEATTAAPQQQYSPSHQPQPQQQSFPPAQQQFPLNGSPVNVNTSYPQGSYPPVDYPPNTMGQAPHNGGTAPSYSGQPGVVPTVQTQTYTMEQLAVAATPLMDAGRHAEVIQLLQQFGAQALTQLPKERYGEFATALRSMGAQI